MIRANKKFYLLIGLLLIAVLALAACSQEGETVEVTRVVEQTVEVEVPGPEVEVTRIVEVMVEPEMADTAVSVIPFEMQWANSPHNDAEAEAFVHWNEDDPAEVPTRCAKCHSTPGYIDFLGADGSEPGVVDAAAPIGTTVECAACHNDVTIVKDSVVFPSGVEVTGLGDESRCMECHQGRASTLTVDNGIVEAGLDPVADADTVSEEVGFSNIHYYAAAATQYGNIAMGGYQYADKSYDSRFEHVEGYDTCISCHDPHTLEVQFEDCQGCHEGMESSEDLLDIRMPGSLVDYDGDGDMAEGVYYEIEGMREVLGTLMTAYSTEITGSPIVYNSASYPYFFADADGDGVGTDADTERYASWTPRLAKAAYNYQVSLKDPGRFAHGGKYIIQLLYDSIEDLNEGLGGAVDVTALRRIDHGHFAGSEEAFRHWDGEEDGGIVPGSCSKCHSANGLPLFLTEGVTISQPAANGFRCDTCHSSVTEFTLYESPSVTFPSGATVSFEEGDLVSNTCINCHQGRESTVSVNRTIGDAADDAVTEGLRFRNVHYFAAGATLFGTDVKGVYEFAGQEYLGQNEHVGAFNSCTECHDTHALTVVVDDCAECHENVESFENLRDIRVTEVDFDGDGDMEEGLANEIATMTDVLYASVQAYALNNADTAAIIYDSHAYPYFFIDGNENGESDPGEAIYPNAYNTWTPSLLRAAYNYQYAQKDPGGYAHNGLYIIQMLYDSINEVGGDTTGMTRP